MDRDKRKDLIRKFGPAKIIQYFHDACESRLNSYVAERHMIAAPKTRSLWRPSELIGRWKDIDSCDLCGKRFQASDSGYVSVAAMSADELELWEEVIREAATEEKK